MLEAIIIISLLSTTIILLLRKWGVLDYYQAHYGHIKWLPKADCYLCFGFWISVVICILGGENLLSAFCTIPIITFFTHIIILHEGNKNQ